LENIPDTILKDVEIIYEDNHLLVVKKPVNMLTQGDMTGDQNLLDLLKEYIKVKYNKPGNVYLGLVHRLDRPVGGVMVFARTSKAASRISEQIRNREFRKQYMAVVHGIPERKKGILRHCLVKDAKTNMSYVSHERDDKAKEAVLEYEVVSSDNINLLSLVCIDLHTGRPHQIRVQFSHEGHPLYGDVKYGLPLTKDEKPLALFSHSITLWHPVLKNEMIFRAPLPDMYPWNLFDRIQA